MNIYQQDGTLHAMDSHSPSASQYRDGRLVVSRQGRDAIRTINRSFEEISRLAKAKNPSAATPPPVSGMVSVHDQGTRSLHLVFVHYLDHQSPLAPAVGNVVAFSEPSFAPFRAENLQLATPAYYRDQEDLKPGIRDRNDGALTKDATRWAGKVILAGNVTRTDLTFVSSCEPWIRQQPSVDGPT